jgi:hypothetical protein
MNNSASTPGTTDHTNKENVPVLRLALLAPLAPQPVTHHAGIMVDTKNNQGVPRLTICLALKANCKIVEDDTSDDDESR